MPKYGWYEGFEYQLMGMLMVGGLQYFIMGNARCTLKQMHNLCGVDVNILLHVSWTTKSRPQTEVRASLVWREFSGMHANKRNS
jgi:hypothetical protein